MRISIVSYIVSFGTALVTGVASLAWFIQGLSSDASELTGMYESPFIYAGLPIIASLVLSMVFAYWRLSAAHVFAIVFVVVFFVPVVALIAFFGVHRWGELIGFLVLAMLSLFANWRMPSILRQQLEQEPNQSRHSDARRADALKR